jgi:class 3 adenylate cyclase
MVEVVNRHGGIVLRFIGDGILAVFGVPIARHAEAEIDADAQNAVHCARAMLGALQELNAVWRAEGLPSVAIRVGIYTGKLLAGSLGSGSHMEYCLQGDTVNSAARIEALGKSYLREGDAGIILIGETTAARLDGLFAAEKVGEIRLKGKERVTTIFRIPDD